MLDMLAEIVSTYGALILAAMGVTVSIIPNIARRIERWWWVVAFLAVGAVVCTANFYELHSSNRMQREVWENSGGDNYCYFFAEADREKNGLHLVLRKETFSPVFNVDATLWQKVSDAPGVPFKLIAHYETAAMTEVFLDFPGIELQEGEYSERILTRTRMIMGDMEIKKADSKLIVSTTGFWTRYGQYGAIPLSQSFSYR